MASLTHLAIDEEGTFAELIEVVPELSLIHISLSKYEQRSRFSCPTPVATATWLRSWSAARDATGLRHLHFHDLRHAGNTLASTATGASTRELMARMGHASPRAALIYQHATSDRDQAIASALSNLAAEAELTRIVPRDGRAMEAL